MTAVAAFRGPPPSGPSAVLLAVVAVALALFGAWCVGVTLWVR